MHFEVWETMAYIILHIKRAGVIDNITKSAPKILVFIGAASALPITLESYLCHSRQPASIVSAWPSGAFLQASDGTLPVLMADKKYQGINYPNSTIPLLLTNDWLELGYKSSSSMTSWMGASEVCVLHCFPEIPYKIMFQSSMAVTGLLRHPLHALSCLVPPLFYEYFLLAFLYYWIFAFESLSLGLLLGEHKTRQHLAKNPIVALTSYVLGYPISLSTTSLREPLTVEFNLNYLCRCILRKYVPNCVEVALWLFLSLSTSAILHNEVRSIRWWARSDVGQILTLLSIRFVTLASF